MPTEFFMLFGAAFTGGMAYLWRDAVLEKRGGSKQWNEKMIATRQSARAPDSWKFGKWERQHSDCDAAPVEAVGYVLATSDKLHKAGCFHFVLASSPLRENEQINFNSGDDFVSACVKEIPGRYFRQFHINTASIEDDEVFLNSKACKILRRAVETGRPVKINTKAWKSLSVIPDPRFHATAFDDAITCPLIEVPEVEFAD